MTQNLQAQNIVKNKELKNALDYKFLREKGIEYITSLSGKLWTDHNSHDPGITFLEMICYALTDLGYRTNFPIKDLLALSEEEKTAWQTKYPTTDEKNKYSDLEKLGLFEAHKILPNHPLTIIDYRKLLLKIEGVRNAWLIPHCGSAETKIFADCKRSELTFEAFEYQIKSGSFKDEKVVFEFPAAKEYIQWGENLEINRIQEDKKEWKSYEFTMELKIMGRTRREKGKILFEKRKRSITPEMIKSLLTTSGNETLWIDFWKHQRLIIEGELRELKLNGLYNVLLELEVDPEMGPLSERRLHYKIPFDALKGTSVIFEINQELPEFPELESIVSVGPITRVADDGHLWQVSLVLKINGKEIAIPKAKLYLVRDIPNAFLESGPVAQRNKIRIALGDQTNNPENSILNAYWRKQTLINGTLKKTNCVLNAHRNLCEDFLKIDLVASEHVGICMDVEVDNAADLEVLMAKINLTIDEYFNPPIKRYSLNELLDQGLSADEIFDGPFIDYGFRCSFDRANPVFTKPGFIKTDELKESTLKGTLYTSDIVNLLMDIPGVISVKNVLLRKFDAQGEPIGKSEKWCLPIPSGFQPVFNALVSKVVFFKEEIPYTAKETETQETLSYLRAKAKKNAYVSADQSFDVGLGQFRELNRFFPLQHDLPDIYGTSPLKLPANKSSERLSKAKNLKAYLLFFEQVFADYLQQLYQTKWLLSPEDIEQSYFTKYLRTEDIKPLSAATFEEEYYVKDTVTGAPFLADAKNRQKLYERDQEFNTRRNEMLDHLLARFAESFANYALMLYDMEGNRLSAGKDLIKDKTNFLEDYPKLSRERGKAFNYRPGNSSEFWNTSNISGLENRFGQLLGMDINSLKRRHLHCNEVVNKLLKVQKVTGVDSFKIKFCDHEGNLLFKSEEEFSRRIEAQHKISLSYPALRNESNYSLTSDSKLKFEETGVALSSDKIFSSRDEYEETLATIFDSYDLLLESEEGCGSEENEGMYLIEHILLRPISSNFKDALLDVCLPTDCDDCSLEDPYSFRITVILPYWPGRFNSPEFRRYFERTLRLETPAHIMPRICWVNNEQIREIGKYYWRWLAVKSKGLKNQLYHNSLALLIRSLKEAQNIYPKATLHDCEEDGGDNPVRLGHTNLGSF